jgi:hypothetical protein
MALPSAARNEPAPASLVFVTVDGRCRSLEIERGRYNKGEDSEEVFHGCIWEAEFLTLSRQPHDLHPRKRFHHGDNESP